MNRAFLSGFAALLCACTGSETINCVEMPDERACQEACQMDTTLAYCTTADAGSDAGTPDANVDAAPDVPASNCTTECVGGTPICDELNSVCVQCLTPTDCEGVEGRAMCNEGSCVECTSSTQCDTAELSLCGEGGLCSACAINDDCMGVMDGVGNALNVCDTSGESGVCVDCTEATAADDCGDFSCNPATQLCTETQRGDVPDCGRCLGDAECNFAGGFRCVPMEFQGTGRPDGYCLKLASETCSQPYNLVVLDAESLSGLEEATYCSINESITTCDAMRALRSGQVCAGGDELLCADAGARCEMIGIAANQCTIPCGAATQCPLGFTCDVDYCGS